jgi:hypothetical protein
MTSLCGCSFQAFLSWAFQAKQISDFTRFPVCLNLPQLVESQLDAWMAEFHTLLSYENAALTDEKDPEKESPVDALRSAVCQNVNLFMEVGLGYRAPDLKNRKSPSSRGAQKGSIEYGPMDLLDLYT